MRLKRMVILLSLVVLTLVFAMMLCSCGFLNGGEQGGGSGTQPGGGGGSGSGGGCGDDDVGWKKVDSSNIYTSLILGCTNVAYQGSKGAVSKKGVLTMDAKLNLTLNGTDLWITLKGKYKSDDPRNNTIVTIDVSTTEEPTPESRIISAYVYRDEIYVALGSDTEEQKNNKIKFSLKSLKWPNYFPYEMTKLQSEDIGTLAAAFNSSVVLNKANKAEMRRSQSGDEYRYTLDIDLDETIKMLFKNVEQIEGLNYEIVDQIKEFVAVFYNVPEDTISTGTLPPSVLNVYFETLNGNISVMNLSFDIDIKEETMLFGGEKMTGSAVIKKLSFGNDYSALAIPFARDEAEQKKYLVFNDTIFTVTVPLEEYRKNPPDSKNTLLKVTTKVFQGEGKDDFVFAEYSDAESGKLLKGIYIYDNIAYFYSRENDSYDCFCSVDIRDLGDLAKKAVSNDLAGDQEFDAVKLFAYIINGVSLSDAGIRFSIKPNFYSAVWYNFDSLCQYINSFTVEDMMEIEGIKAFLNYVKTNEVILTFETHGSFFQIVNSNNRYVRDIVSMLGEVDDEVMLTPVGGTEE